MNVVINALAYKKNSSGIGVLISELLIRFSGITQRDCRIVLSQDSPAVIDAGDHVTLSYSPYSHRQGIRRILFQSLFFGKKYCRNSVLLTTDSKVPFFLPKSCRVVPVVTDLALLRMPDVYQLSRVLIWRLQYRYLLKKSARYVAISAFTKNEMIELLHIDANKIDVVYCAANKRYARVEDQDALSQVREKYRLDQPYILFVGNANPRKNLARLIQAFDQAKEMGDFPYQLILAGEYGWKFDRHAAMADIKHAEDIRFLDFVADEDMPGLYSAASLFAFPTLYEGFGIPIIEAQQCGVPVLASNTSSLPEVGGADSACYVDPQSVEDICRGMRQVLCDASFSEKLVTKGYENAARFDWTQSAEQLNTIVEKVIQG
ncbi:MAG: glycosyltransferase family 1 protein [Clostridiaceae bacterium]